MASKPRGLLGLLEDLDQAPALGGAERTGLADQNEVTDAGGVEFVVHLPLGGAADDLAVQRVLHAVFDLNDDGFLHAVADDVATCGLAVATNNGLGLYCGDLGCCALSVRLSHYLASSVSVSDAASAASFFLVFFAALAGTSTATGVARMPSSRSRMIV
jgi:hypothetical protein